MRCTCVIISAGHIREAGSRLMRIRSLNTPGPAQPPRPFPPATAGPREPSRPSESRAGGIDARQCGKTTASVSIIYYYKIQTDSNIMDYITHNTCPLKFRRHWRIQWRWLSRTAIHFSFLSSRHSCVRTFISHISLTLRFGIFGITIENLKLIRPLSLLR